jgi:hypothetical protein
MGKRMQCHSTLCSVGDSWLQYSNALVRVGIKYRMNIYLLSSYIKRRGHTAISRRSHCDPLG